MMKTTQKKKNEELIAMHFMAGEVVSIVVIDAFAIVYGTK